MAKEASQTLVGRSVSPCSIHSRALRAHLFLAISAVGAVGLGPQAEAADFSGNATLTSDYVWRGSTQTQGDPAVQAGFKVAAANGVYASIWGSNVEFAPDTHASTELDFVVGWGRALNDNWTLDLNVLRYQYPSTAIDLNWTELNSTITYHGNYWLSVGVSNEALGYQKSGVYTLLGARFPVNDDIRIEAAIAHYALNDSVVADSGYSHGWVSAIWTFKAPFEARLTVHGTDANARHIFGDDYAGTRVEAALQASY